MVSCRKGVSVNGIPRNSEDPRICNDLKDHFSRNRQPRGEQIYINCGLLSKIIQEPFVPGGVPLRRPTLSIAMLMVDRLIGSFASLLASRTKNLLIRVANNM